MRRSGCIFNPGEVRVAASSPSSFPDRKDNRRLFVRDNRTQTVQLPPPTNSEPRAARAKTRKSCSAHRTAFVTLT